MHEQHYASSIDGKLVFAVIHHRNRL